MSATPMLSSPRTSPRQLASSVVCVGQLTNQYRQAPVWGDNKDFEKRIHDDVAPYLRQYDAIEYSCDATKRSHARLDYRFCQATSNTRGQTEMSASISLL